MNATQKIYYALGQLAYLVALADGKVQESEIRALHKLVINEIKKHNTNFEYSDIIFNVLNEEKLNPDLIYEFAINELKEASEFITESIKNEILSVLTNIASSYDNVSDEELKVIRNVEEELKKMV